jgi:hypothetical protein
MTDIRHWYFRQEISPRLRNSIGVNRSFHRIRPEANIWAIGAIMWSLVTMNEIEVLSYRVDDILKGGTIAAREFDGINILNRPSPEVS